MRNKRSALFGRKFLIGASAAAMMAPAGFAVAQDNAVDEIVVTVERREQSLQDYAGTAAQLSGQDLKSLGISDMTDLDGAIPGLNITNNQGNVEVWIRGVGSSNNTELGDPAAATHMNGIYVPRPAGFGSAFFDIERVEVNFGPQGTIRGRQAMAGSVDVIPFKPGLGITEAMIEATTGSDNLQEVEGVINTPVTENSALRFAFFANEQDSLYTNSSPMPSTIDSGLDDGRFNANLSEAKKSEVARLSYYIEPTDQLDVSFVYDLIKDRGTGYTGTNYIHAFAHGQTADSIDDGRNVISAYGRRPQTDTEHWGAKIEVNYEAPWFDIQLLASRRELENNFEATVPMTPYFDGVLDTIGVNADTGAQDTPLLEVYDNNSFFDMSSESDSTVGELRFISNDDSKPYSWTTGLFYFQEEQRSFLGAVSDRNASWETYNNQMSEFNMFTDAESYSAYADGTYEINDRSRASAGIRYTDETKERYGVNVNYRMALGGWDGSNIYNPNNGTRIGSNGFAFAKFNRSIFNPDTNLDGSISQAEQLASFQDGVASYGASDTVGNTFSAGILEGGWNEPLGADDTVTLTAGQVVAPMDVLPSGQTAKAANTQTDSSSTNIFVDDGSGGERYLFTAGTWESWYTGWVDTNNNGHHDSFEPGAVLGGGEIVTRSVNNADGVVANTVAVYGGANPNYVGDDVMAAIAAGTSSVGMCVDTQVDGGVGCLAALNADNVDANGVIIGKAVPYPWHSYAKFHDPQVAMQSGKVEEDFTDWRIRYEYDLEQDWKVYGVVATGHKAGGFNDNLPAGTENLDIDWSLASSPVEFNADTPAPTFDTENVTYYELGSKQQFDYGDIGVTLNASAFYYDYDDMVVSSVMTVGSVLSTLNLSTDGVSNLGNMVTFSFNAADASIIGLHIDGGLDFANGYNLDGSLVFLDSELDPGRTIADGRYNVNSSNENNLQRDIDGHELPRTPDIQAKVNLSKSHFLEQGVFDWILSAGYKGEYYSTIFNSKLYGATDSFTRERLNGTMGDFWTIDVGFGFEPAALPNVKVEGFISNLTDEHEGSVALITQDTHTRFFNSPRNAGLRVRAKF